MTNDEVLSALVIRTSGFISVVQAARLQCRQRKPQASRLHYDFLERH